MGIIQKIETTAEMRAMSERWRMAGEKVVLVPTSGALHPGHREMMRLARQQGGRVVVSIFVNPLQFGPSENLATYPRPLESDLAICAEEGVDAVFLPPLEQMYPKGFSSFVVEEHVSKPLCGVSRPTHFRGVVTCLAKMLNVIQPRQLVLGEKDAQMVAVVKKVIADLQWPVEVLTSPTIREADGLAYASRNGDLTTSQRAEAVEVVKAMRRAQEMSAAGVRSTDRVIAEVTHLLRQRRRVRVIYIAIVHPETMEAMREVEPGLSLLAMATWVDEMRMTDSMRL